MKTDNAAAQLLKSKAAGRFFIPDEKFFSAAILGYILATLSKTLMKSMERVKGIEPSSQAWEARILPLDHTRFRRAGER